MVNQGDPKYLFIIGKGLDVSLGHYRLAVPLTYHDLIPPAGSPGSDLPYGSGFGSNKYALDVPVGGLV